MWRPCYNASMNKPERDFRKSILTAPMTEEEIDAIQAVEGLHLSPRTVEKHVASLLAKTGCRRRAQLAGYSARLSG